jgi:RNA exonuclease 1
MFPSNKFKHIQCPVENCTKKLFCFFSHEPRSYKEEHAIQTGSTEVHYKQIATPTILGKNKFKEKDRTDFSIKKQSIELLCRPKLEPKKEISYNCDLKILPDIFSKIPLQARQKTLELFYEQFKRIYSNLKPDLGEQLAKKHAFEQEQDTYDKSSNLTFKNSSVACLMRLKRRKVAIDENDVGLDGVWKERVIRMTPDLGNLVLEKEKYKEYGYPSDELIGIMPPNNQNGKEKICNRCGKSFKLNIDDISISCTFHWSTLYRNRYPCCNESNTHPGCAQSPHVFKEYGNPFFKLESKPTKYPIIAMDCEMAYTTRGMEIVRISIVDWDKKIIYDKIVKPTSKILCLNSKYSGIHEIPLDAVDFPVVLEFIKANFSSDTIIIGHGLENDFYALGLIHYSCVDTSILYRHPKGLPYRYGLKYLTKEQLGRFIQDGEHDSTVDSIACIDLVLKYLS